jgi:hypothetical protein
MREKYPDFFSPALVLQDRRDTIATTPSSKSLLIQSTTELPADARNIQPKTVKKPWTPFVLRRWVLIGFSVTLLAIIIGLEIVQRICDSRHGFGPVESNLQYVWTYGPTAGKVSYPLAQSAVIDNDLVFTLAAAFWTQVDYRTRLMQPWEELAKGTRPARRNLFLDHISPHPVLSFCSALKLQHWPVAAVLLASFALKALVVMSTGLLALQVVNEPTSIPVVLTSQIQERDFNASSVDFTAVSLYKSSLIDHSSYTQGTNAEFVVETFSPSVATPGEFS